MLDKILLISLLFASHFLLFPLHPELIFIQKGEGWDPLARGAIKLFTSFGTASWRRGEAGEKPQKNVFKALILMRSLTTWHQHSNLKQTAHKKYQFIFSFKTNYLSEGVDAGGGSLSGLAAKWIVEWNWLIQRCCRGWKDNRECSEVEEVSFRGNSWVSVTSLEWFPFESTESC